MQTPCISLILYKYIYTMHMQSPHAFHNPASSAAQHGLATKIPKLIYGWGAAFSFLSACILRHCFLCQAFHALLWQSFPQKRIFLQPAGHQQCQTLQSGCSIRSVTLLVSPLTLVILFSLTGQAACVSKRAIMLPTKNLRVQSISRHVLVSGVSVM